MSHDIRAEGLAVTSGAYRATKSGHIVYLDSRWSIEESGYALCGTHCTDLDKKATPTCKRCIRAYNSDVYQRGRASIWNYGHAVDTHEWMDDAEIALESGIDDELIERPE